MSIDPQNFRQQLKTLAAESLERNEPSSWFEPLYRAANSDPEKVPWAKLTPHPQLQAWLATQLNRDDIGSAGNCLGSG